MEGRPLRVEAGAQQGVSMIFAVEMLAAQQKPCVVAPGGLALAAEDSAVART